MILPSFLAWATSSFIEKPLPFSGGLAAPRLRAARAAAGEASTVSPIAAAALRRSICERLISLSSSLAQNSCSWAS